MEKIEGIPTVPAKTIVTRCKDTSWFGTSYTMNLYRGCCHGCIYCDSRSDCYRIENFDQVRIKEKALEIVRNDLRRKVKPGVVGTGAMSDPYNPFERKLLATRHSLELLSAYEFGVAVVTKSPLITRDIDLLQEIQKHSPVLVKMTITTIDDNVSKQIEPKVAVSSQRFEALKQLSDAGIFCGIVLMPVLPWITDSLDSLLDLVHRAKQTGCQFVYPALGVTLRDGQREYFYQNLEKKFPGLKEKYAKKYRSSYQCSVPDAKRKWERITQECQKLGLLSEMKDITDAYKRGYQSEQLTFL